MNKRFRKNINSNPFELHGKNGYSTPDESIKRTGWSEDVFFGDNQYRETIGRSFNLDILKYVYLILLFLFILLLSRSFFLQIIKGDYYYGLSETNRIRKIRIEPKRGVIYDVNKLPLVRNKANFMLYFTPIDLPEDEDRLQEIFDEISTSTSITEEDIRKKLSKIKPGSLEAYQPLFITDNIPYLSAMQFFLKTEKWSGVSIESKTNREYLNVGKYYNIEDDLYQYLSMSHILGYTGKINQREFEAASDDYSSLDYIGKMGVEYFWENELKGKSGIRRVEVDTFGKRKKILGEIESRDGNSLVLSLDINAQEKLEEILKKYLVNNELSNASAIVLNPQNGEIVSMVNLPSFNNNSFASGISTKEYKVLIEDENKPLFNRGVSGEFPSGSTIKIVMAAAALQERVISETTSFLSTGGINIGIWRFPDWRAGGHGRTNVRKAISQSVNTFFYIIGGGYNDFVGLGINRIVDYYKKFGLGSQLGVDLAGEADGFVPTKKWKEEVKNEPWYIGDTYHVSIGQGDLLVTPLQVAVYTSFFANGGKIYRPHFVKEILNSNKELLREIEPEVIREDFIDDYNIMVVRSGMRETVKSGSARSMYVVPVEVAGKTGTAQWSSKKKPHAWFTGFAPYDNPELVITVLVEEGEEGSRISTSIAREFLVWYFGEYKPK